MNPANDASEKDCEHISGLEVRVVTFGPWWNLRSLPKSGHRPHRTTTFGPEPTPGSRTRRAGLTGRGAPSLRSARNLVENV